MEITIENAPVATNLKHTDIKGFNLSLETIEEFVNEGKKIVKSLHCHQAVLAYYTIKVCDIRHGGRSDKLYTIKDYARDIGIPFKTLQNWTLVYRRVVQHLDIPLEKLTPKDWQVASKVAYQQEHLNRIDNATKGTNRRRPDYKPSKIEPEVIKKKFQDNYYEQTVENEVMNWCATVRGIKGKIQKRDLSLCPRDSLVELMSDLDFVSDHINDFLSKKKSRIH